MISKAVWNKAQNLEVIKIFENENRIEFVVGYPVTFHKKAERIICNCTGHVVYDISACAFKVATALRGKGIPAKIKEAVEEEEVR